MTRTELEALARVRIAAPCPAKWSEMEGDEKKRLCRQCNLHVHRVSQLTTNEALTLFRRAGASRVCVELFWRLDGTVMTKDCPSAWSVGLSEAVKRVGHVVSVMTAVSLLLLTVAFALAAAFGDNVRAVFGGSTGALEGYEAVTPTRPRDSK